MALTDKLSAIGDAIRAKTGKPEKLTLDQMPVEIAGITGGGALGPLSVTENGEYNAAYEAATFTWGEETEYDFTVEAEGIPLRVKKIIGFSVPDDVKYLNSPDYAITVHMDGEEQVLPLKELALADFYGAGYMSDGLMYAVVWVKNAALFNETVGEAVFEDNSVYVTDFLCVVSDGEMAGATFTLTAPGKKLDGISSVTVDVEAEPNNHHKYIYENGDYYPDDGYDGFSQVTVDVPIPDGYVKPSGTKAITENGTHDVSGYAQAQVNVDIPDPVLQEKTATENGEVLPDAGYDGLSKVTVAVESSGGGGAELNIAYGDTEPTDTSKLWVKAAEPNAVNVTSKRVIADEELETYIQALTKGANGIGAGAVGTKIYLFGGRVRDTTFLNTIQVFDTENRTITTLATTLPMAYSHMATATVGTKIYLFGGFLYNSSYSTTSKIYVFDAEAETISSISVQLPRSLYGIATATVGTKIYLFGGSAHIGSAPETSEILLFDAETETVHKLTATLPRAATDISCASVGTKIYLFGGRYTQSASIYGMSTVWEFNVETHTIKSISVSSPPSIYGAVCVSVGTKIYMFGGSVRTGGNETFQTAIRCFDSVTFSFSTLSSAVLPEASAYICCASIGTKMYLFGGAYSANSRSGIHMFNAKMALEENTMLLEASSTKNLFNLLPNVELGVMGAYIGNSDGYAELADAFLYSGIENVIIREGIPSSSASETTSGTELTASVNCAVGDLVVAAIATRDTLALSDGWTLISTSEINSIDTTGNGQRLSWAWKFAESTTESITVTQASAQRLYINMIALRGATAVTDNGYAYRDDTTSGSMTVAKPDGLVLWGLTTNLWGTDTPYPVWTASNEAPIVQLGTGTQSRLGIAIDQTNEANVTFQSGSNACPMIIGSLTVQGMDKFYTDNSYHRRVWENVNTGEKLTFRIEE